MEQKMERTRVNYLGYWRDTQSVDDEERWMERKMERTRVHYLGYWKNTQSLRHLEKRSDSRKEQKMERKKVYELD